MPARYRTAVSARERDQHHRGSFMPALMFVVLLLCAWEVAVRAFNVNERLMPAPSTIIHAGFDDAPNVWEATKITALEVGLGTVLALVCGVSLAFIIFAIRPIGRVAIPVLIISQTIPVVAIAPLLIIWFGFGITSKVLLVGLFGLFPIVVPLARGLASPSRDQIDVATTLGASKWWILTHVRMPAAAAVFMSGLRITVTYGPATAATAEFVGARNGLGIYLLTAQSSFRTELVFVGAAVLTAMTLVLYGVVALAERIAFPWKAVTHASHQ